MARKKHYYPGFTEEEQGAFYSGVNSGQEDQDVHAYYVGVGYGKGVRGDRHVGFNRPEHYANFRRGVDNSHKHFTVKEVNKPWWKRLFSREKSDDFARGRARKQKKQAKKFHRVRIKAKNKRRKRR